MNNSSVLSFVSRALIGNRRVVPRNNALASPFAKPELLNPKP